MRGAAGRAARTALAVAAALAWAATVGAALAQPTLERDPAWSDPPVGTPCADTGAIVDLRGVGRATYDVIRVEGDRGRAVLDGGVCIELDAQEVRIRIARLELAGLPLAGEGGADAVRVAADDAVLDVGEWRLRAATVRGAVDALDVTDVVLLGPGVLAAADAGALVGGAVRLTGVRAATDRYLFAADAAQLPPSGDLVLTGMEGTSCRDCPVRLRFAAARATADVGGGRLTLDRPQLRVLGVPIALGGRLEVGDGAADVALPFAQREVDGLGVVSTYVLRDPGGAVLQAGTATKPDLAPVVRYDVARDGDRLRLAADADGVALHLERRGPDAWGATTRVEASADLAGDAYAFRAGPYAAWEGAASVAAADVRTRAGVGLEGVAVPPTDAAARAGVRLPAYAGVEVARDVGGVRLSGLARLDAQATRLAAGGEGGLQAALTARAGVARTFDAGRVTATLHRRFAAGARPFGLAEGPDPTRLEVRSEGHLGPRADAGAGLRGTLRAYADVDLPAGGADLADAGVRASVTGGPGAPSGAPSSVPAGGGPRGRLDLEVGIEAGASVEASAAWADGAEVRLRVARPPDAPSEVTVGGVRPFVASGAAGAGRLEVVPTVAVDVAPWLRGEGGPRLVRHGVQVASADCCGRIAVGYLSDRGEVRLDVGVTLPPLRFDGPPPLRLPVPAGGYGGTP